MYYIYYICGKKYYNRVPRISARCSPWSRSPVFSYYYSSRSTARGCRANTYSCICIKIYCLLQLVDIWLRNYEHKHKALVSSVFLSFFMYNIHRETTEYLSRTAFTVVYIILCYILWATRSSSFIDGVKCTRNAAPEFQFRESSLSLVTRVRNLMESIQFYS